MSQKFESRIIILLVCILIIIGLTGCSRNIQNCSFKPGITVESKPQSEDGETPKSESKIEERLPVKVSPKGAVACNF